jgi:hypothetical protein
MLILNFFVKYSMKTTILSFLLLFAVTSIFAQLDNQFYFGREIPVNNNLKKPGMICRQHYGDWHFSHDQLINYLNYLTENFAYIVNFSYGKGNLIVFSESPDFRCYWYGMNKLFLNSIYFGDIIKNYN